MRLLLCFSMLPGCASTPVTDSALTDRVRAMRADQAKVERRVEEMENRLMLLEDRLDTRRVADEAEGRTPTLPVVRLLPPPASEVDDGQESPGDATEKNDDSDAAPRPMLRLHGNGARRSSGAAQASAAPLAVEEKLTVVPLPKTGPARTVAPASKSPAVVPPTALISYRKSYDLVLAGKYDEAQRGLEAFLRAHADHDYADNAAYWVAECHYARRDWTAALAAFRRVVDEYPRGNKAPDALLKLGFTYLAAGDRAAAVQVLEQVKRTYSNAQVAALAQARLEEIHD